jgi:hypothetical protein
MARPPCRSKAYPINATEEERKTFQEGRGSMQQGFHGNAGSTRYIPRGCAERKQGLIKPVNKIGWATFTALRKRSGKQPSQKR